MSDIIEGKTVNEEGPRENPTNESSEGSRGSTFDPDVITEEDIDRIWARMKKSSAKETKHRKKLELNLASTDTTPTTDYNNMLFTIHPDNLKDALELDKQKAKMEEVLRKKRAKPKTYLTQVILYDNVSHERLLHQKLHHLQHRHKHVEKQIKRKRETFIQKLENKQNEWTRLDARVVQKLQPENMPELSFKFGRLYHSADYPYQAAINTLRGVQPPKPTERRRLHILPQITRKMRKESLPSESDSGNTDIFVTKLPKMKNGSKDDFPTKQSDQRTKQDEDMVPSWKNNMNSSIPATFVEAAAARPAAKHDLPPVGGRRGPRPVAKKNWLEDSRYITLTSLLGPRFSPKKKYRSHDIPVESLAW